MKHISKLIILLAFIVSSNAWGMDTKTQELLRATENNHIEYVKLLVWLGADVNAPYEDGYTPLMVAAWTGSTEMVKVLLEAGAGATINAQTKSGSTALLIAASHGKTEDVKLLLEAGADITVRNSWGNTALDQAIFYNFIEVIMLLSAVDPHNSPTVAAITSINKIASNLIKINWDVNKNNIKAFKLEYRASSGFFSRGELKSHIITKRSRTFYLYGLDLTKNYYITIKVQTNNGWSTQHGVVLKEIIN